MSGEPDPGALHLPRARIGLIIPSANTLSEPEFHRFAPPRISVHVARVRIDVPVQEQRARIEAAATLLADARCNIVIYHCTGSSMERGAEVERDVVEWIERATGGVAATTATAVIAALRALAVSQLVLVTPYDQALNDRQRTFLHEAGIDVVSDVALDLMGNPDWMCGTTTEQWIRTTRLAADRRAGAYLLSCTNIQSMDAIGPLEHALERPVVTSNQASLWYGLRRCGVDDPIPELGALLANGSLTVSDQRANSQGGTR